MRIFKKSTTRLRNLSTLLEVGGVSGGFLGVWLAAEPISGVVAVAGGVAISQLVKRAADDREKRDNDKNIRITADAIDAIKILQAQSMREILTIKSSLNFIVLSLAALVIAYSLRSIPLLEWQTYVIGAVAILFLFYVAPWWRGLNNSVDNEEPDLIARDQHSPEKTVPPKRK